MEGEQTADHRDCSLRLSIILASIAVVLRPTNVLIWAVLGTILVTRFAVEGESPLNFRTMTILVRESLFCGYAFPTMLRVARNIDAV